MNLLSIAKWVKFDAIKAPLITLDDESSLHFELCIALDLNVCVGERWLTCVIREKPSYTLPSNAQINEVEADLISGGGGLRVEVTRSCGMFSHCYIPVTHGFIGEVLDEIEGLRESNFIGQVPIIDCSPWLDSDGIFGTTRAFRASIRVAYLKKQHGLMVLWHENNSLEDIFWYTIDHQIRIALNSANKMIGICLINLQDHILDLMLKINREY